MAASDVSICSNALLLLGAKTISSFDENNDRARLASNLFESVRDSMLRSHPWNCAIRRVALAPDVAVPAFDWDFQFTLPGDFMRVLSVGEAGAEIEFKIEDGKLLCDDNPALLRYVYRNENPATWDDMLVRGMELAMAEAMAYGITQSATLRDSMRDELARHMKQARAVDGQDDTPETLGDSPLLNSRFGSSTAWRR
jgi:hypothetical protein